MSCLDLPNELLLQVLQLLDVKDINRVQRCSRSLQNRVLAHSLKLRKLAYPIVFNVCTPSLRVTVENCRQPEVDVEIGRNVAVNMSDNRSRIYLSVTRNAMAWRKQDRQHWCSNTSPEKCPPIRPKDFPNDETVFEAFLTPVLRHIDIHWICVDSANASMLAFLAMLVGSQNICDGSLTIGCFLDAGSTRTEFQQKRDDVLVNEALTTFKINALDFMSSQRYQITRNTVKYLASTCNQLSVRASLSSMELDDELLNNAIFPRCHLDVGTQITPKGLRRLLESMDKSSKFFDHTRMFVIATTQPRLEFFETMVYGLSGTLWLTNADSHFYAEFKTKNAVLEMYERQHREGDLLENFIYTVYINPLN